MSIPFYLCLLSSLSFITKPTYADGATPDLGNTLLQGQNLTNRQSLTSPNKRFTLQFLSSNEFKTRYLGMFYCSSSDPNNCDENTQVWVANRNNPVPDTESVALSIDQCGNLVISYNAGRSTIPISHISACSNANTTAVLDDRGNFVLTRLNTDGSNSTLWQSFDYPATTLLPGMKLGGRASTSLISSISDLVFATGSFRLGIDTNGTDQLVVWWHDDVYWKSGLLRNGSFENLSLPSCYNLTFASDGDERYFTYSLKDCNGVRTGGFTLNIDGHVIEDGRLANEAECPVLLPDNEGCIKKTLPMCRRGQGKIQIRKMDGYSYDGDSYTYDGDRSLNLSIVDCAAKCADSCSCVGYSWITQIETGCRIWTSLNSNRPNTTEGMPVYTFEPRPAATSKKKFWIWLVPSIAGAILIIVLTVLLYFICRRRKSKAMGKHLTQQTASRDANAMISFDTTNEKMIRTFSLDAIVKATDNFCDANKLGRGGYGPVYKGILSDGQEVAIKRLSTTSAQGFVEFENEVLLIAKLQHTNLVRLIGKCTEEKEMILVYEYMPNKSLDHFLFDSSRRRLLNWTVRMNIIEGVAQGLSYLHNYSRLKVIHRDLKAGNVLLDHNMHPKISDFGMARIFEAQESATNTKKIMGTPAYMSPEYLINGSVSVMTDVYSFGVLLLEIITGKKNHGDTYDDTNDQPLNLVGLAYNLWNEKRVPELIDPAMEDDLYRVMNEAMKCVQIGLLCVQDNPMDRPSMTDVASMLTNEFVRLATPKQPSFFNGASNNKLFTSTESQSINGITVSVVEGR